MAAIRCQKSGLRETASYAAGVHWFLLLIASVTLSSPFGEATATAVGLEDGLEVVVTIEMDESFEAVLIRPFSSFEELDPTAMVFREDGEWGADLVLPSAENWSIVFDAIRSDGTWERSDATDLVEMGVDPVVVGSQPAPPPAPEESSTTTWWLVGGAVLGLAALGALAWWAFMPSRGPESASETEGSEDDESAMT